MKNETLFIKSTKERTLTAKAYKFVNKCVVLVCEQRGYTRYHAETKSVKSELSLLLNHLFIDKGMSIEDIKLLIKNRYKTLS
jgi:hypothetical protein